MARATQAVNVEPAPERSRRQTGSGEGLRGVLGDVVGDSIDRQLAAGARQPVGGRADRADVYLGAETKHQDREVWVVLIRALDQTNGGGRITDRVGEQFCREAFSRGPVVLAGGIEADDGMEVHHATFLVFGHLDVADPDEGAQLLLGEVNRQQGFYLSRRSSSRARVTAWWRLVASSLR